MLAVRGKKLCLKSAQRLFAGMRNSDLEITEDAAKLGAAVGASGKLLTTKVNIC